MRGFFTTVLGTYIAVNAYLFVRLFQSLAKTGLLRGTACVTLLIFAMCFPFARILSGRLPDVIARALMMMGNLYVAPMLYGFILTLLVDIFRALNSVFAITHDPPPFSLGVRLRTVTAVFAISLLITLIGAINANMPVVKEVGVFLGGNGERGTASRSGVFLKIAVLSEIGRAHV